jgi:RNA-directed DNA polymerase
VDEIQFGTWSAAWTEQRLSEWAMKKGGIMTAQAGYPTFGDVRSFTSLLAAFRRARRAKRGKGGEPEFYLNLETNLLRLSRELSERTYRPDPYRYFPLRTPKSRVVSEASFRDRIVHHSLVGSLEPGFERQFVETSYACRKDKGVHLAIEDARAAARRWPFFLKMDFEKYFDSIWHEVLLGLLRQQVTDPGILWLCKLLMKEARVPGVGAGERRGLPIGNLTSQFWANVYLDPLDHFCCRLPGVQAYARYMDDLLLFSDEKTFLGDALRAITEYAQRQLRLHVKEHATVVAPVNEGIPWLGFRVFPGAVRLKHAAKVRFYGNLHASMAVAANSPWDEGEQVARSASLCGHVAHGNTRALRKAVVKRHLGKTHLS